MVDVAIEGDRTKTPRPAAGMARAGKAGATVRAADAAGLADYRRFCEGKTHAPPQSPIWVEQWIAATNADALVVTLSRGGQPVLALVLEVVQSHGFRTARFPGESHANGNFVPSLDDGAQPVGPQDMSAIAEALRLSRPDIDAIVLERQNPEQDGRANPLAECANRASPNVALAIDLDGGFEEVLARANGRRKRKKYRMHKRKFEEGSGYKVFQPSTGEDVERLLDTFFVLKADRFERAGIRDVFAPAQIKAFFHGIFRAALDEPSPPFFLHVLEVDGTVRAINGLSVTETKLISDFGAISDHADNTSPGFFLDFLDVEWACERELSLFDFGVGDAEYKRSWCDIETRQFDILIPLNWRGHVCIAYHDMKSRVIATVKEDRRLWAAFTWLRSRLARPQGRAPETQAADLPPGARGGV